MMKNTLYILLSILTLGLFCRVGLPWWSLTLIAALAGWLWGKGAFSVFGAALLAGFVLWFGSAWYVDAQNNSLLSGKVGQLFMGLSTTKLLLVTGLLGGLLAGLGALSGYWAKDMLQRPSSRRHYMQERRRR